MDTQLQNNKPILKAYNRLVGKARVSKGEQILRDFFNFIYQKEEVYYNYRPDWLLNKNTGHNLELDIFYPNRSLAIEFQGIHHKLEYQIEKDKIKIERCNEEKIKLIKINYPGEVFKMELAKGIRIPGWLRKKVWRYKRSRKGKTGKYVRMVERKLKNENYKTKQNEEIRFNSLKLARKTEANG